MAKKKSFSGNQKLYIGILTGLFLGLIAFFFVNSFGNFTLGFDDDQTAVLTLKNPSFETTGNWLTVPSASTNPDDVQYSYSTYSTTGWPTDGTRSFKIKSAGWPGEILQSFRMPESAESVSVQWHLKSGYMAQARNAVLRICDLTTIDPEPVIQTNPTRIGVVTNECKIAAGSSRGGNPQTLTVTVPEEFKGHLVQIELAQMSGSLGPSTGPFEVYWDNIEILDAQGRVL